MTTLEFLEKIDAVSMAAQDIADETFAYRFSNPAIREGELESLARRCDDVAAMLRELEQRRFPQDLTPRTKNQSGGERING